MPQELHQELKTQSLELTAQGAERGDRGGWSHSREFGLYPKGREGPGKDFKCRGEAEVSSYLGQQAQKWCGSVKDCTTSAQVCVENQQEGRLLMGNVGCLPKISLIKANAFCSLRWVVFIFSMSEARGGL